MRNLLDLAGQTVLVAGAAGAIGSAAARALAALGAQLVLTDLKRPDGIEDELRKAGARVSAHAVDNSSREQVDALLAGIGAPDALADCSGYYRRGNWLAGGSDWEALFAKTMEVNVLGPFNLVRACLPRMMERGVGRIALVGSMGGRNAGTTTEVEPAYIASKGALHAMVRFFARQCAAHGVVVNAVAPGPISTPMLESAKQPFQLDQYPMKRLGRPEEVGWPVAFLCSPATGFMTGAVLDVNGGLAFS